jgi:hypothetical protein
LMKNEKNIFQAPGSGKKNYQVAWPGKKNLSNTWVWKEKFIKWGCRPTPLPRSLMVGPLPFCGLCLLFSSSDRAVSGCHLRAGRILQH